MDGATVRRIERAVSAAAAAILAAAVGFAAYRSLQPTIVEPRLGALAVLAAAAAFLACWKALGRIDARRRDFRVPRFGLGDAHLEQTTANSPPTDASQALYDALAELRSKTP